MRIARNDAKQFLAECPDISNLQNIKKLSQAERIFLLQVARVAANFKPIAGAIVIERNEDLGRMSDDRALEMMESIKDKISKPVENKKSTRLESIFKGIANNFFGRVSADKVCRKITEVKNEIGDDRLSNK